MKKLALIAARVAAAAAITSSLMAVTVSAEEVFEPRLTHDCGYSPQGTAEGVVLSAINEVSGPHSTILVAAYEFTSRPITQALIAAKVRGVAVAVVADTTENRKPYSKIPDLIQAGIPVRFDNHLQMLHDKFMVLNGTAVETGSFNFTSAAASDRHAENACVFRHAPLMAAEFTRSWKDLWNESDQPD
jgi:phosphatidylserine/phosphatidylglycerophosphate/cardiolipin synthase-like enzyme